MTTRQTGVSVCGLLLTTMHIWVYNDARICWGLKTAAAAAATAATAAAAATTTINTTTTTTKSQTQLTASSLNHIQTQKGSKDRWFQWAKHQNTAHIFGPGPFFNAAD